MKTKDWCWVIFVGFSIGIFITSMLVYMSNHNTLTAEATLDKTEHVCANEFYFGINLIRVLPKPENKNSLAYEYTHNRALIRGICDENFNFKMDSLEKPCEYNIISNYKTVCFDRIEGE